MRAEDHSRRNIKDFDCIVRYDPDDPGTFTELKSLQRAQNVSAAMKAHVRKGTGQLADVIGNTGGIVDGHVIVDCRDHTVSRADVLRTCQRLVGQANAHRQALPKQVRFILTDTASWFFDPATSTDHTGTTRFDTPDDHTFRTTRTDQPEAPHERD